MTTNTSTPPTPDTYVICDECGRVHRADYSHEAIHGDGPVYVVYCPSDPAGLADYYTTPAILTGRQANGAAFDGMGSTR